MMDGLIYSENAFLGSYQECEDYFHLAFKYRNICKPSVRHWMAVTRAKFNFKGFTPL